MIRAHHFIGLLVIVPSLLLSAPSQAHIQDVYACANPLTGAFNDLRMRILTDCGCTDVWVHGYLGATHVGAWHIRTNSAGTATFPFSGLQVLDKVTVELSPNCHATTPTAVEITRSNLLASGALNSCNNLSRVQCIQGIGSGRDCMPPAPSESDLVIADAACTSTDVPALSDFGVFGLGGLVLLLGVLVLYHRGRGVA